MPDEMYLKNLFMRSSIAFKYNTPLAKTVNDLSYNDLLIYNLILKTTSEYEDYMMNKATAHNKAKMNRRF